MAIAIGLSQLLYIELCSAVKIFRRRAVLLRNGVINWTTSINAYGASKHKSPDAESLRHFQQVEASIDIDLSCPQRLSLRHGRQDRGQVNNCVDRMHFEHGLQSRRIADVTLDVNRTIISRLS